MTSKKILSKVAICMTLAAVVGQTSYPVYVYADSFKAVTLGTDLTDKQKEEMLKYFGVTKNTANVVEITSNEEKQYLGSYVSAEQLGNKSISCSYVEPRSNGGIEVETNNVDWVNANMIKNALITAGVQNAKVRVSAPFEVSGTAALTGILKGFENANGGKKVDETQKKVANEEVAMTGKLGQKIGQDKSAALVNEVKKEVVKEKPKNDNELKKTITGVTSKYNYKLTDDDKKQLFDVMKDINSLSLDYSKIKTQMDGISDQLKSKIDADKTKGFCRTIFDTIGNFFSYLAKCLS